MTFLIFYENRPIKELNIVVIAFTHKQNISIVKIYFFIKAIYISRYIPAIIIMVVYINIEIGMRFFIDI